MRTFLIAVFAGLLLVAGCHSSKGKDKDQPANGCAAANTEPQPKANETVNANNQPKDPEDPEFCLLPPEARDDDLGGKLKVGSPAPEFALTDIQSGKEVKLADYKGKTVLLFFWASWCPYCKGMCKKDGSLQKFSAEIDAAGVTNFAILGVGTSSDDSPETQGAFLKSNECTWASTHDTGAKVEGKYGVLGVPTAVLVDDEGKVLTYGTFRDPYRQQLLEYLKQECLKPVEGK